ncbi:hypothetical protein H3S95_08685, partial [Bartonella sp. M0193]|nr:hypothetical protein [Bartonella sp. M0193]
TIGKRKTGRADHGIDHFTSLVPIAEMDKKACLLITIKHQFYGKYQGLLLRLASVQ